MAAYAHHTLTFPHLKPSLLGPQSLLKDGRLTPHLRMDVPQVLLLSPHGDELRCLFPPLSL